MITSGDTHLGGGDSDKRIMQCFIELIEKKFEKDISGDARALQKLRRETERAKRALFNQHQLRFEIKSLHDGVDLSEPLTRARFEELSSGNFKKTLGPVRKAMEHAGLKKNGIHEIVLVGGSIRVPKVKALIKEYINGEETNKGINSHEAVDYCAAVQGSVLGGDAESDLDGVIPSDVAPLTLGIETVGGVMRELILRNTVVSTKKSQVFTTYQNQQTNVTIQVLEGERALSKDSSKSIPTGSSMCLLKIRAKKNKTSNKGNITIAKDKGRLSPGDIQGMVQEAEEFAEQDKLMKKKVDGRRSFETYCYNMKNTFEDKLGGNLKERDKTKVTEAVQEVLECLDDNPDADIEEYNEQLKEDEDTTGARSRSPHHGNIVGNGRTPPLPPSQPDGATWRWQRDLALFLGARVSTLTLGLRFLCRTSSSALWNLPRGG
ncbi:hypothetical protein BSKO_02829 [Bryopsis sp. KO-2023]|nr:hypothetical protein BSKO_02829 [Bryopsis sp. KO-2023]